MDIHVLHKQGVGIRAIARKLNLSKNTVRKYLRSPDKPLCYSKRPKPVTKLGPYEDYLHERIAAAAPHWIPASVLYREIQARGYPGGASMVRRFASTLKPRQTEPVVRFETEPGEQLQVDFTTIRRGKSSLKAFVATLGYSRASFVHFSHYERQDDWLTGIELALEYFGGTPKTLLFDNAKCIMIERDAYGEGQHKWNPKLLDQAKYYGYQAKACKPYRAQTKGKVERFNRYLKESFITPLAATLHQSGLSLTVETANQHIGPWLQDIANERIHGTTQEAPNQRLNEEREVFSALPTAQCSAPPLRSDYLRVPVESFQHPLSCYDLY